MSAIGLHIALPVMDEYDSLPKVISALYLQTIQDFRLYICVNQPDEWWADPVKQRVCISNAETIDFIRSLNDPRIEIIDRSSPGKGWIGKAHGIGWARKTIMDRISESADPDDILISLDADTTFGPAYLESIRTNATLNPRAVAYSLPYYHALTNDENLDRAMLRYEIYMRAYAINLWTIKSPYCFTALGSAIALPVWAYRKVGGLTPKLSGEDFYFLQKLTKYGMILHWNNEMVYPAARLSERVYFGTGPALIKGISGNWDSYPVYRMEFFRAISDTYKLFPKLYERDLPTPLDSFLNVRTGGLPWDGIRRNSRSVDQFIRACHEKLDGLRILQYLKEKNSEESFSDEASTLELLDFIRHSQQIVPEVVIPMSLSFSDSSIPVLDAIRNAFTQSEMSLRKEHWTKMTGLNSILN